MADQPSVCCVMLTADRPAMARRAVEYFRAQTYQKRVLLILDTGRQRLGIEGWSANEYYVTGERGPVSPSIGWLRNAANSLDVFDTPPIIIHWDDDDWSQPNRIAEQVELLQLSGADIVGYNQMLFWRDDSARGRINGLGEAWLYTNPSPLEVLGTSLCYWHRTWEQRPFEATSQGEDFRFCLGRKVKAASSLRDEPLEQFKTQVYEAFATSVPHAYNPMKDSGPRMIARIHAGNTSHSYSAEHMSKQEWRRVPEWDEYVGKVMKI